MHQAVEKAYIRGLFDELLRFPSLLGDILCKVVNTLNGMDTFKVNINSAPRQKTTKSNAKSTTAYQTKVDLCLLFLCEHDFNNNSLIPSCCSLFFPDLIIDKRL